MPADPSVMAPDPLVGTMIAGRYRIDAVIDQGAMGRVYSATHVAMRKRVALKVLRPELTRVPEVMERFAREARAAGHIVHPNVAVATDFGELPDGAVFLVLEFVEGITLRSVIEKGALPIRRVLGIVRQVALALQAAHALSIVHRDLKPENVMLVGGGTGPDFIKVLDFGVAKVPIDFTGTPQTTDGSGGTPITKAGMVFGTPDYMAIEQALGQEVDGRADLYSLGVIAYEMITGRRPFRSNHEFGVIGQQLTGSAPAMSQRAPWLQIPRAVDSFVANLLQTELSKRTASAEEVLEQVDHLLQTIPNDLPDPVEPTAQQVAAAEAALNSSEVTPRPTGVRAVRARRFPGALASWHSRLPEPLSLIPLWVYAVVGAIFVLGGFGIVAGFWMQRGQEAVQPRAGDVQLPQAVVPRSAQVAAGSPDAGRAQDESGREPTWTDEQQRQLRELAEARQAGDEAVAKLLGKHEENGWIRIQYARELIKERNYRGAFQSVAEAVRLDPSLVGDKYLAGIIWFTAQHRETRDESFKLLAGEMLAAGADIMYDLAVTPGVADEVASRARDWIGSAEFQAAASVEARVAGALLRAQTCEEVSALLPRAESEGDKRALVRLRRYDVADVCSTQSQCPLCADGGSPIHASINRLATRLSTEE